MGHRKYVGGLWEEMGELQFRFLLSRGLLPEHWFLDIACGSLRLGVKVIPYLETGHYLGIEKEGQLVEVGLRDELGPALEQEKQPNIVVSADFEFDRLGHSADYAMAQSLFTHLPPDLITRCFSRLYPNLAKGGVLYATFFESDQVVKNPGTPNDHGKFAYTRAEMLSFGEHHGFSSSYIGDWNHPRGQVMVEYRKSR